MRKSGACIPIPDEKYYEVYFTTLDPASSAWLGYLTEAPEELMLRVDNGIPITTLWSSGEDSFSSDKGLMSLH